MTQQLHCYEYVARPFASVRDAILRERAELFGRATESATGRAQSVISDLKISVAGLEVGKNVVVQIAAIRPTEAPGHVASEALRVDLEWQAETNGALFPSMRASLSVYPLSPTETQLDFQGSYAPPGGVLGDAADRLIGHRVAEAAIHRFVDDVARALCAATA
jgi:hypothetical protein